MRQVDLAEQKRGRNAQCHFDNGFGEVEKKRSIMSVVWFIVFADLTMNVLFLDLQV